MYKTMSKYDDHMIRAATLRKSGNDVKARMHEEHAQYKYGFGARIKRRRNTVIMHFHHPGSKGEDGDCDSYTIELNSPLAAEQKVRIVDIRHGDQKDLSREPFFLNTDVWLTVGADPDDPNSMGCYLNVRSHDEMMDSAFKGPFEQLVVFPALEKSVEIVRDFLHSQRHNGERLYSKGYLYPEFEGR